MNSLPNLTCVKCGLQCRDSTAILWFQYNHKHSKTYLQTGYLGNNKRFINHKATTPPHKLHHCQQIRFSHCENIKL